MKRVRISTTVDGRVLDAVRGLVDGPDSEMLDRALRHLLDHLLAQAEREALDAAPYESDPAVNWLASDGPSLPYDGAIPPAVLRLAEERRNSAVESAE